MHQVMSSSKISFFFSNMVVLFHFFFYMLLNHTRDLGNVLGLLLGCVYEESKLTLH